MNTFDSFAILFLAGAIHASFQVSVSMLTLLSGHSFGRQVAHTRVMQLAMSFLGGAITMTLLGLSFGALVFDNLYTLYGNAETWWIALSVLSVVIGIAVWVTYYRRGKAGTELWIPRGVAIFLRARTKATRSAPEAFGLGLMSIVAETLFIVAPLAIAACVVAQLAAPVQLAGLAFYVAVANMPLLLIVMLIGGGHSVAKIQKWREHNKRFLQFAAGSALIILGVYFYVDIFTTVSRGMSWW